MPWFKVDDSFESHPKVKAIPRPRRKGAVGLWTLAGCWCARQLTDGHLAHHMVSELCGSKADAAQLVAVGLWETTPTGYVFHDWHDWQPTKVKVEADRATARERMKKAREQRGSSGDVRPNTDRTSDAVRVTPSRPDPSLPENEPADAGSALAADASRHTELTIADQPTTAQVLVGEWLEHCTERPPGRVVGQVAKELKALLAEGIGPDRVRRALAEWNRKGLHPSALASVVHEITNRQPEARGQQATNDLFDRAMGRALDRDRNTA